MKYEDGIEVKGEPIDEDEHMSLDNVAFDHDNSKYLLSISFEFIYSLNLSSPLFKNTLSDITPGSS